MSMSSNNLLESICYLLIEITQVDVKWNYLCSVIPDRNYFKQEFMPIIRHLHSSC